MKINMLSRFEVTAEEKKDAVAVVHNNDTVTFGELKSRAISLAAHICKVTGGVINTPVAVFLPKEINAVAADIAIMYSCNSFMNLDVKTPKERICNTLNLIKPAAVITSSKYKAVLEDIGVEIILVDEPTEGCADASALLKRREQLIDTDPMCLINTSGSTGTPKSVVLNHRSFFDFMNWSREQFGFDGSEVMGSLSPVVFDIFDFELCMLMMYGTRLVLLDSSLASFPARLLEAVEKNCVSFIFWVPSIMVNIANLGLLEKLPLTSLKLVWFAGEVFPTKQFLYWYDMLPEVRFVNMYGPIEITLDCTFHEVTERPAESEPLPIGIPCRNTDILILNDEDKRCAAGEEGELCVRGTSLAMGYYNNPEKTAAAFVQNPLNSSYPELIYRTGDVVVLGEDGLIAFKGRKDSLIKHMGYRIELGEIESVLINETRLVEYCCAVYHYAKREIVLYYESKEEITVAQFRNALKQLLPAYMLPSVYIRMDLLPRNTNGKIDRLLLKIQVNEEL